MQDKEISELKLMVHKLTELVNEGRAELKEVRAESKEWRIANGKEISHIATKLDVVAKDVNKFNEIEAQFKGAGKVGKLFVSIGLGVAAFCASLVAIYKSFT